MLCSHRSLLRLAGALADTAVFIAAFILCDYLLKAHSLTITEHYWSLAIILPISLGLLWTFGFYSSARYSTPGALILGLLQVQVFAGLILPGAMFLTRSLGARRAPVALFLLIAFALLTAEKLAFRFWLNRFHSRILPRDKRVLVIGTHEDAERYRQLIKNHVSMHAEVVGILLPASGNETFNSNPAG
jgi:FlaA1/EpsC-like NDP-sugar epimerase